MEIVRTGVTGRGFRCSVASVVLAASVATGCGGDTPRGTGGAGTPAASVPGAARADTTAAGTAAGTRSGAADPASGDAPQLVALGDSVYHGLVGGGTCQACHGPDAKGSAIGPDLTDSEWLHSDGSHASIVATITSGVPNPKKHPAAMPPLGGGALSPDQVRAVAAYVYSLRPAR